MPRTRTLTLPLLATAAVLGCGAPASSGPPAPTPAPDAGAVDAAGPDALANADAGAAGPSYPIPDWPTGSPESVGLDSSELAQADAVAAADSSYCLLVVRHGVLVWESYFQGHDASSTDPSWSIAKSYASTVVGIALDRGDIHSLDDSVADYVPSWSGTDAAAVTIRDLLEMTSGLHWDAFGDYVTMATLAPDKTSYALGLSMDSDPGKTWVYDNAAVQVLEPVIRGATGEPMDVYAEQHLWSRVGMHAAWDHDDAGHPTAYANVRATCRDHARFGYLWLHGGRWATEQVVSAAYVAEATSPSQALNRAYGYLFWVNGQTPAEDAMMEGWPGWMSPGAPPDLFAARGFGNQFIDVIPSLDMVVVRFGEDPMASFDVAALTTDARFETHDAILAPILAATH